MVNFSETKLRAGAVALALLFCTLAPATLLAESAPTMELAASEGLQESALPGMKVLRDRRAKVSRVIVAEVLPMGGVAAELELDYQGKFVRYPVRFERVEEAGCKAWKLSWAPEETYTGALLNMVSSGQLPETTTAATTSWVAQRRLPSMPVVLTRFQITTPYGSIKIAEFVDKIDPSQKGAQVAPPPLLYKHTKRWISEFLQDDPGPAGVDIIADKRATWADFNRVIVGALSQGFYQVNIITSGQGGVAALPVTAPIKPVPLVVRYYPFEQASGFRVSSGAGLVRDEGVCDPEMSFCVTSAEQFDARLTKLGAEARAADPAGADFVMFATTGEVALGDAVRWIERMGVGLEIAQRRVLIGFIQK